MPTKEERLYEPIRAILESRFSKTLGPCRIWRTDRGKFPPELMREIPIERDILLAFGRAAFPNLTGFLKRQDSVDFITVEIDDGKGKLEDI